MIKPYEMLYIVPAQYTEPEVQGVKGKVTAFLEKAGAKVLRHETLAKIRLAYPIKKVRHGTYVLVHFDAEPAAVEALERSLRLSDDVLRHQIVMRGPLAEKAKVEITAYVAPLSEEGRREAPARAPRVPVVASPTMPAKPAEESLSVEELDKRLDALLEEDVTKSA